MITFGAFQRILQVYEISQNPILRVPNVISDISTNSPKKSFNCRFSSKYLDFTKFNLLLLPGANIQDTCNFIPRGGRLHILVLFTGVKDLFNGQIPSEVSAEEVANKISNLANVLKYSVEKVLVLGIPHRHNQRE